MFIHLQGLSDDESCLFSSGASHWQLWLHQRDQVLFHFPRVKEFLFLPLHSCYLYFSSLFFVSYSGPQSQSMPGIDHSLLGAADIGEQLRMQDVGEGSVKIRLYEGRVAQGPLRGTSVVFKVYPGKRAEGVESDMMAANELNTHAFLQSVPTGISQNLSILVGGFETTTGEQWLAFRNDGKFCAVDYAKIASEKMSEDSQTLWNGLEAKEKIRHRRKFILKLLHGTMVGLAFMHKHDRLHQSLGPSSITLNTVVEKEAVYLIPRLRDLAFSVNIRYPELDDVHSTFSLQLWRRAAAAGAFSHVEKRAFGIADDIYEAGLLFAYLAFIPFCQAGIMDSLSLRVSFCLS
ncbi:hypothetical protein SAY87_000001 [Trapa incisa]|uniref:Protein kinase domain-containing protein n=1 Tax=Trapa incisa TaxID=236973 RepID=A0AAN7JGM7_9MYRT|nr:hypothetical protein SAY87_000001 [Trapa incisa]